MKKTYVLDTNILMQTYGEAILGFADNDVVITGTTLEELDHLKSGIGEKGYSARCAVRKIRDIYGKTKLNLKVKLPNGGTFRIETKDVSKIKLPTGWDINKPDNYIIATALDLQMTNKASKEQTPVILITNDVSMQIKAQAVGLVTQDYLNEIVNKDDLSSGKCTIYISDSLMHQFFANKFLYVSDVDIPNEYKNAEHLFIHFLNANNAKDSALGMKKGNTIVPIGCKKESYMGVSARNMTQYFALEALKAPADEIPLVILRGPAGSGKTLLAIAVGLDQTLDTQYQKIIISRSNTLPEGEDIGFLPGSLEDKMEPLMAPFYDNIETMIRNNSKDEPLSDVKMQIEDYIDSGVIEITSLAYIRGRSIPNSYIIIDEAQNLTRNQVKTIVTRAGAGTKIVLLGDPDQIDSPKLTKYSNGLIYAANVMKDSALCVQLEFDQDECERSVLASETAKKMKDVY